MKTRFESLTAQAEAQGCILERSHRSGGRYDLDNKKGTCAACADLNEVAETLAFDESFGALPLPTLNGETFAALVNV